MVSNHDDADPRSMTIHDLIYRFIRSRFDQQSDDCRNELSYCGIDPVKIERRVNALLDEIAAEAEKKRDW